jgi:hypothetical protein
MDQLKVILKQLQKYHFWLLSIVAIIAGMVGTMLAARSLSATYMEGKGRIVAKFNSLSEIRSTDPYPNNQWKQAVEKLNGQEQTRVRKAWEMVYDEQKPLLVWSPDLKDDFLEFIAKNPPNKEIPPKFCERYGEFIKNEFPRLLKIIDAAPVSESKASAAGRSARNADEPPHEYRVVWDAGNQGDIHKTLSWVESRPSSAEVRRAQEDLWVYAALLTIIKKVNDEHQFTTPVREIEKMVIGKPAADAFESDQAAPHIIHLQTAEAPAAAAASAATAAAEPGGAKAIDEGRYVDENGKKLGPGLTENAEFKRMPIFLRLKIDQRQILRFLVECANSPLPVEVRQLRINSSKGAPPAGAAPSAPPRGAGSEGASYDLPMELHGIIYIYNKPNMAKLGGQGANAAGGPDAPGSAPAAVPAQPSG